MAVTVLIVEDSETVRRLLETCLRGTGDVATAGDGETGLEMAQSIHPDVITLDIGLPGIDGWEVLRRLRALPALQDIRVCVVTAMGGSVSRARAEELGADDFIEKPFHPLELRRRVAALTATQPAARVS